MARSLLSLWSTETVSSIHGKGITMKFSKTGIALAAALGTVSALGLASEANAGAVAYATLDITNFRLSSGGQVLDAGAFSQLGILNTVGASGSLNGVTQAFTNPPSPG